VRAKTKPAIADIPRRTEAVQAGDRAALARAITLVESTKPSDKAAAQALMRAILPATGKARRIGITGVPGVGKSTFIESLGLNLVGAGHKLGVLAIDPSSTLTGGSILGDKTRMARLATHPNAFIRPSPTSGTLGGVARATREAMLLAEAAGFDIVLIETVGVGQSETLVAGMVDLLLLLLLPGAGDELQGMKKGILELADLIVVNKADGDMKEAAMRAQRDYHAALKLIGAGGAAPGVLTASGLKNEGLDEVWATIEKRLKAAEASGEFAGRRARQGVSWMWALIEDGLKEALVADPAVKKRLKALEKSVAEGRETPTAAANEILALFRGKP
jgi:LAO/AO transport system kinase